LYLVSRRFVLGGLLSSAASAALAGAPVHSKRPHHRSLKIKLSGAGSVEDIVKAAGLSGKVGFVVADATTGEVLERRNPLLTFPPASVTKTVTTLYALETLGETYRFGTRLLATGPLEGGQIKGDLYLVGGGDPTLDTDALGDMARQLKKAGVREISGNAYVYSGALPYQKSIDPGQPEYLGYNPSLSGLNLNYNRVFFQWRRQKSGYLVTMDARARKFRPHVSMASIEVVARRSPIFTVTTSRTTDHWTVAKHALGRRGGRWLPVRRPEFYAAEVLQTIARSFGIVLPNFKAAQAVPEGTVLAQWQSRPLKDVLRRMLKYSTNLTAEASGVTASRKRGGNPTSLRASARMMSDWANTTAGTKHARFVDHSGLGEANRISARDMVALLQHQGWNGSLRGLMKTIHITDARGRLIKKPKLKVRAKTGTLNFVSGLAGYMETPGKHKLVFAIFADDLARRTHIAKSQKERPKGARGWNRRAKAMQQKLMKRWATIIDA